MLYVLLLFTTVQDGLKLTSRKTRMFMFLVSYSNVNIVLQSWCYLTLRIKLISTGSSLTTGLPLDITEEEFVELMSKYGIIMQDPDTSRFIVKSSLWHNFQLFLHLSSRYLFWNNLVILAKKLYRFLKCQMHDISNCHVLKSA